MAPASPSSTPNLDTLYGLLSVTVDPTGRIGTVSVVLEPDKVAHAAHIVDERG